MPPAPSVSAVVLVVEDDPQIRELHRTALRNAGYGVVAVEDGLDALNYLDTHTPPAAVVLDLGLPRVQGEDVQREMAAMGLGGRVPVIVVTGEEKRIDDAGFACVLRKPISPDRLVGAVDDCLKRRRSR